MHNFWNKLLVSFLSASLFIIASCKDENSDNGISEETLLVNRFIDENMQLYYLWNESMPSISPNKEADSEEYFYKLINTTYDRWSYITNDYSGLVNYLNGIQKDFGYSYVLSYADNSQSSVIAILEYVYPNSPADKAGLKRGDIIYKINDTAITADNYSALLNQDTYTLTLGLYANGIISPVLPKITIAAEVLEENPILYHDVIASNGKKVGYLVYNSFIDTYDDELISVFENFKSNNVTELVLDLRYNGGGMVSSAQLLASMIGPTSNADKTMVTFSYNNNLTDYFQNNDNKTENFKLNFLSTTNLNLQRVFVLTTNGTASASEMIIYSLKPYMKVVQIGMETTGKYYASTLINDTQKKHNWAMLPLFSKMQNANSSINYTTGMLPDYEFKYDDYSHQLGDINEAMLNKALAIINGNMSNIAELKSSSTYGQELKNAKEELNPLRYKMILRPIDQEK